MKVYKVYNDNFGIETLFTSKSEAEKYAKSLDKYYNKDFYDAMANNTSDMDYPSYYTFHVLENIVYNNAFLCTLATIETVKRQ